MNRQFPWSLWILSNINIRSPSWAVEMVVGGCCVGNHCITDRCQELLSLSSVRSWLAFWSNLIWAVPASFRCTWTTASRHWKCTRRMFLTHCCIHSYWYGMYVFNTPAVFITFDVIAKICRLLSNFVLKLFGAFCVVMVFVSLCCYKDVGA